MRQDKQQSRTCKIFTGSLDFCIPVLWNDIYSKASPATNQVNFRTIPFEPKAFLGSKTVKKGRSLNLLPYYQQQQKI